MGIFDRNPLSGNVATPLSGDGGVGGGGGGGGAAIEVQDEGSSLTTAVTKFNFAGSGVTVTEPVADQVLVTILGASSVEVQDEGSSLTTAVTRINFAGAGVTVTEPVADQVLVTIPAGANTALSNLAATSVSQDLIPLDNAKSLGSTGIYWAALTTNAILLRSTQNVYNSTGFALTDLRSQITTNLTASDYPSNTPGSGAFGIRGVSFNGSTQIISKPMALFTANDAQADAVSTSDLFLETGNKTAGTGSSGSIRMYTGTSAGGTRGKIKIRDGTEGTVGHVWTSTDASGAGGWAAAGGVAGFTSPSAGSYNFAGDAGLATLLIGEENSDGTVKTPDVAGAGYAGELNLQGGNSASGHAGNVIISGGFQTDTNIQAKVFLQGRDVEISNGVLNMIPITTTQRNALTPSAGFFIFNSTISKMQVYTGGAWETITSI